MVVIINIAICDYEKEYALLTQDIITHVAWEMDRRIHTTLFYSTSDLLKNIETQIDALIINPTMRGINGIEAARLIKYEHPKCIIILLSDDNRAVLEGYTIPAYRFLLKSDGWEKLQQNFLDFVAKIIDVYEILTYIREPLGDELRACEILYVESSFGNVMFHTSNGESLKFSHKLNDVECELNKYGFIRIHKSFLVNVRHVEVLKNHILILKNGEKLIVSKSRIDYVRTKIEHY